jgi:hypothetical protein
MTNIDLITEATPVWAKFRRGEITREQVEVEVRAIEERYGIFRDERIYRPTGDEIDEGYARYKDATDA